MTEVRRSQKWVISKDAPSKVEDLSFVSIGPDERPIWWKPEVLKTRYSQAHCALGTAYAYEFLDFMNNPHASDDTKELILGFIVSAMIHGSRDWKAVTVAESFMKTVGTYMSTGAVYR
ncbi:hypothetical protein [Hydrocarboniphaga effusa]|nr:hypothetical protein [Hydrocarboniphaga effusa]